MTWDEAVLSLANQVEDWVSTELTKDGRLVLHETLMAPEPDVPVLEMEIVRGSSILRLEPAGFAAGRVPTKVHLYAYPTLRRVVLYGPFDGDWKVQTSEGVPMNYPWNREGFVALLRALATDEDAARRF